MDADQIKTVSVNLPQSDIDKLQRIAIMRRLTMTETLRRAILMQEYIEDRILDGDLLLLRHKDGTYKEIIVH